MRALEEDVGVRLLARTTRSVSLTEAGEQLLGRLRPALTEVGETLEEISGGRDKAAGHIRLLLPRLAIRSMLAPTLGKLSREYPEILLDVTTDDSSREIVAEGFDAGIHFGEYIEKDMIAVRVSPDHRPGNCRFSRIPRRASSAEGSARSVATPPRQFPSRYGRLYRWEFEKGGKSLSVAVSESLIVDDLELIIRGAIEGVGPAFVAEQEIASELADGRLTRVLQDWCQPHPGFFIYCPSRRQQTAALSARVSILRL